jgi:hypothetical protein
MQKENEKVEELNNNEHKFNQSKDKRLNLKHTFKTLNNVLIYKENEEREKKLGIVLLVWHFFKPNFKKKKPTYHYQLPK